MSGKEPRKVHERVWYPSFLRYNNLNFLVIIMAPLNQMFFKNATLFSKWLSKYAKKFSKSIVELTNNYPFIY